MIFDDISNIDLYNLPKAAVDFIKALTPDIECGRYNINDNIYANIETYTTKEAGKFEAHRNYIDIQILLSGEEFIDITRREGLSTIEEYSSEKDIEFLSDGENYINRIKLEQKVFAVIYPHEAHKPQLTCNNTPLQVKKVVIKIKITT